MMNPYEDDNPYWDPRYDPRKPPSDQGPGINPPNENTDPEDDTPHVIPVDTAGPSKPTQPFPADQRPPSPDPDAEWNDTWWDGKSPYLGGWLVSTTTHPNPGVGGTGGHTSGGTFNYGDAPVMDFPGYESAGNFAPRRDTFNFERFAPNPYTDSSWADAEAEPGYAESQGNLMKQIEQGAANRGILRSGMTLKNEAYGLNDFKQQNFRNFDDRRFRNWSGNEQNRYQGWMGNLTADQRKFEDEYGIDKDIFNAHATDVDRGNNFRFNVSDARFKDSLARWQTMVDSLTRLGTANP